MSTRALRKLQREQEQIATLRAEAKSDGKVEDIEGSEEEESTGTSFNTRVKTKSRSKLNAFQMLEDGGGDEDDVPGTPSDNGIVQPEAQEMSGIVTSQSTKPKRKKKRKAKDKGKERDSSTVRTTAAEEPNRNPDEVDEIDRALQELNIRQSPAIAKQQSGQHPQTRGSDNSWEKETSKLLAIDSRRLNATNEMKSLFGSIALDRTRNQGRIDEGGRVDLETALSGRHSPISRGKELGSLAKRRNIFMQGQENWPLATSGGLGMEVERESGEDRDGPSNSTSGFGKQYKIVHNSAYEDTQRRFMQAVDSMSAEAMIHLLVYNPYHIATLLQVAEIAKHQGDHSVTGDLLERALFTFGRSVHSTFGLSVREGQARLSFEHPANRELYLTIWRYIQNLEMRGTWRTAFEWSKLLLSFNVLSDPYGITHALDQYALRGRQHDALIALCSEAAFGSTWSHLPNMQISLALAYHRASQPKLARQKLAMAMHRYPYILAHLCSTLEIDPLPKSLWGITPSTDAEKLFTELYVTRAKDLWATTETTALLVEVAETLDSYSQFWKDAPSAPKLEISLEDARHVLLLDLPPLIALVPRNFRNQPTAQYDVLPPPSSINDAGLMARAPATGNDQGRRGTMGFLAELMRAASRGVLDWGLGTTGSTGSDADIGLEEAEQDMNHQDIFNVTLADANLSPADHAAIIAALDGDEDTEYDYDIDDEEQWERGVNSTLHQPHTGSISNPQEDLSHSYPGEERPRPSGHSTFVEQTRNLVGSRLAPMADSEARDEDADVNVPLPANQQRPGPPSTLPSPPSITVPEMRVGNLPPAPTVEDDSEPDSQVQGVGGTHVRSQPPTSHLDRSPNRSRTSPRTEPGPDVDSNPDPQRIQRYLLRTGLSDLQAQKPGAMAEYVRHLHMLRHRDREWTLGAVRQRIGADAGVSAGEADAFVARIRRAMD